jgi:hypothetical protein
MPPVQPYPHPPSAVWQHALVARETSDACALTAAQRIADSASRVDRTIARLNQSGPRVSRHKQRRSDRLGRGNGELPD